MPLLKRLQFLLAPAAVAVPLALLVAAPALIHAEDPAQPNEQPADNGADAKPAPKIEKAEQKTEITPDAQAILDKVRDSYKGLASLSMKGKVSADIEIDGQKNNDSGTFTSTFEAPNKFRHEMEKDVVVGSTGSKMFVFKPDRNTYIINDAPKDKVVATDLPSTVAKILDQQNPAMLFALSPDAGAQMVDGIAKAEKADDLKIDDTTYTVLKLTGGNAADVSMVLDPKTYLVRRVQIDMKKPASAGGQNVKKALFTIDYTEVNSNPKLENEQFAWTPPEGSKEFSPASEGGDAMALEGKMVPDITIAGLDGKEVKLKDLRGQVIVLDFWATWCGPCRIGLPHLDKLYQATKDKPVKVFAVNLGEEKADINEFIKTTKLTVPVLVDSGEKALEAFKANAIPETVIVGKDGKILKVFVGITGDKMFDEIQQAVEDAAK